MNDLTLPTDLPAAPDLLLQQAEFLAAFSHELRTPLAAIKGFSQMLVAHWDDLPDGKRRQQAECVLRSTLRVERLVQDLTLAARMMDGVSVSAEPVQLGEMLAHALDEMRILHPTRTFECAYMAPAVAFADRDRVQQVLGNLLDNAARYAPPDTPVNVRCWADAGHAHVEVSDTGLGFSPEEQTLLFLRFSRLRPGRRGAGLTGGSGLGLFICKQLVEAMGGAIGVRVDVPGPGNAFWFTLPLPPAPSGL